MKAKLIKHEVDYYCLLNNKGEVIADVNGGDIDKLSLKNCQAIERGYDLDELADFYSTMTVFIKKDEVPTERQIEDAEYISEIAFKEGFQKALDLNNTKLYILEDMMNCWNKALKFQALKKPKDKIKNYSVCDICGVYTTKTVISRNHGKDKCKK